MNTDQIIQELPYLIAGLGNPGRQYRYNRHNIGFMALDRLAARLGLTFSRLESKALLAKGTHQGRRVVLAKPQTYMNLSGKAVASLARFYKVPLVQLLVVYDDVDLPFGTLRLRPAGSSGGQRGMESIIENLGSQEFPRLRLGIGRPPGRMEAGDYVLEDFSRQEMEFLPGILDRAVDAIFTFFDEGLVTAMNRFNGLVDEEV
jgi:PTH1 family peptidyl-tRNA hydrolase